MNGAAAGQGGPDLAVTAPPRPGRAALALAVVFFANGAAFASWIPRIPELQAGLELSNAALGLVLAGGGAGGLFGTVLSPVLLRRVGSRPVAVLAGAGVGLSLPLVAVAPAAGVLAAVLFTAAAADALTDIAMNDLGVHAQRITRRSLMNRLHAGWSLGALVGAVTSSAVSAAGVSVGVHFAGLAVVLTAGLVLTWPHLPDHRPQPRPATSPRSALGAVAVLVPLAFAAALVEGTPAEWSGVLLATEHDLGPGTAGLGFTLFAAGMLVGRLGGDAVTDALGGRATARVATGLVVAGLAAVVLGPGPAPVVAGFGLAGLGASVMFPLIYGAAGSLAAVTSGAGLALMSIEARVGFLAGPPLVGALSEVGGLPVAMGIVVGMALIVVASSQARLDRHLA
jgi:MFS family permease